MLRLPSHVLLLSAHAKGRQWATGLATLSLEQLLRRLQCASVTNNARHHTQFLASDSTANSEEELVNRLTSEASLLSSKRFCDSTDVMHASLIASNVFRLGIGASTPGSRLPSTVVEVFLQIAQRVTEQHRGVPALRLFRRSVPIDVELESQMDMAWTRVLESITPALKLSLPGGRKTPPPQSLQLRVVAQCVAALQRSATWGAIASRPADDPVNLVIAVFLLRCSNLVVHSQGTMEAEAMDVVLLAHQVERMLHHAQRSVATDNLEIRDVLQLAFALHDFIAVQRDALRHTLTTRNKEFLGKKHRASIVLSNKSVEWAELWMRRTFAMLPGKLTTATLSELSQMLQLGVAEAAPLGHGKFQLQLVSHVALIVERMDATTIVGHIEELAQILSTSLSVDGATYLAKTVLSKLATYPHVLVDAETRAAPTDNVRSDSLLVRVVSAARTSALLQSDRSDAFVLELMQACSDVSTWPEQEVGLLLKVCIGSPTSAAVLERVIPPLSKTLREHMTNPGNVQRLLGISSGAFCACAVCVAVSAVAVLGPSNGPAMGLLEAALRAAANHFELGTRLAAEPERMVAASIRSIPRGAALSPIAADLLRDIRKHQAP